MPASSIGGLKTHKECVVSQSQDCQQIVKKTSTSALNSATRATIGPEALTANTLDQESFLNSRRRILPDAVLGTASTKRTSLGCL